MPQGGAADAGRSAGRENRMTSSDWIAIIGIASGLIAFGAGLWQYRRAQQWKRAEFVAKQMNSFERNLKIGLALQRLDWNSRTYELAIGEDGAIITTTIDDELLGSALLQHSKHPDGFEPAETQIRADFAKGRLCLGTSYTD